jgi:hypothetical protein
MGNRWLWIGIAVIGIFGYWGVGYVVAPNGGDAEFQKMLESMEQVKSFRGTYADSPSSTQHFGRLWEVDCNRGIVHHQSRDYSQAGANSPFAIEEDKLLIGSDQMYTHSSDGSWEKHEYKAKVFSASWYCDNIAQGTVRDLMPDVRRMLRSAMIGKADKKTVNGVRCQDWQFTMKSSTSGEKGSVCIGLEDHLPYEMIVEGNQYFYSDYNRPIQFDAPEYILQTASSTAGSN